jgi:hypothetical protein
MTREIEKSLLDRDLAPGFESIGQNSSPGGCPTCLSRSGPVGEPGLGVLTPYWTKVQYATFQLFARNISAKLRRGLLSQNDHGTKSS